jgi:hypothetical protein
VPPLPPLHFFAQVWFSSCWSHSTKAAFQCALSEVLGSNATNAIAPSTVLDSNDTSGTSPRWGSWLDLGRAVRPAQSKQALQNLSSAPDKQLLDAAASQDIKAGQLMDKGTQSTKNAGDGITSSLASRQPLEQPQPLSMAVLQWLQHWQRYPDVALAQSRKDWLGRVVKSAAYIGAFKRRQDRLAMARYTFTGTQCPGCAKKASSLVDSAVLCQYH